MESARTYDMAQFRHPDDIYVWIHARVVGSQVNVVMLRDQMVGVF